MATTATPGGAAPEAAPQTDFADALNPEPAGSQPRTSSTGHVRARRGRRAAVHNGDRSDTILRLVTRLRCAETLAMLRQDKRQTAASVARALAHDTTVAPHAGPQPHAIWHAGAIRAEGRHARC